MRVLTGIVVAFIVVFIFGWAFHGVLLADHYAALPDLYRAEETMSDFLPWLLAGQLLIAIALVLLLNLHRDRLTTRLGLQFGLLIGLLSAGSQLVTYGVMPFPLMLVGWWVLGSFVQMTLLGALLADILKDE